MAHEADGLDGDIREEVPAIVGLFALFDQFHDSFINDRRRLPGDSSQFGPEVASYMGLETASIPIIPSSLLPQHLRAFRVESRWATMPPHRSRTNWPRRAS